MSTYFFDDIFAKQFEVRLRFKRNTTFHYYHGGKLYGLISRVINLHPIGKELIITPCESGRINYNVGDEYNFGITVLKNDPDLMVKMFSNLQDIPASDYSGDLTNATVEMVSIKEVKRPEFTLEKSKDNIYEIRFITPLRIEKKDEEQQKGKKYFDPEYFDTRQFLVLLYKRLETLYLLNNGIPPEVPKQPIPEAEILERCFIWVDMPKDNTTLGGIQGMIKMKIDLDDFWLKALAVGQIVHAGKNTSFGFGEYAVNNNLKDLFRIRPVKTLLDCAVEKENLVLAFKHIKRSNGYAGIDGITTELFEQNLNENLKKLANEVRLGYYQSSALQGIIMPNQDNKIRARAVPAIRDNILQKAVSRILEDSIEHLLEENSFAFRKGLSKAGALRAIKDAYKKGFNYIIKCDIESLFDNVDWQLLFKKIDILYGCDPISGLLKQWVETDIYFDGVKIKRTKGLPQGAVIAPVLANLFLDEFDEAIGSDFKLIRYADGFIILCKSKDIVKNALNSVIAILKSLTKEIRLYSTNILSFEDGFQYLGYLFHKSLMNGKEVSDQSSQSKNIYQEDLIIPKETWLTLIYLNKIKPLKVTNKEMN